MAWIEVHQSLPTHPKTIEAAMLLDVSEPVIVGHLVCLWTWAVDARPDGQLDLSKPRVIARAARWDMEPGRFVDALVAVRFLDDDGAIHDWDDYTGRLMERRERVKEQTRGRVQAFRERQRSRLSSIEGEGNADVTRYPSVSNAPVTLGNAPTVPNPTVPNPSPTGKKARDADAPAVLAEHQAVINAYLGAIGREPKDVGAGYKRYLATGAEMAKRGDGPEDVAGCTRYLLNADWRRRGGTVPTLENVRDYLAEWVKDGRLERPPVGAAGGAPQHAQRKSVTATAMEGINGALSIAAGRTAGGAAGRGGGREDDPPVRPGPVGQELRRQLPG